MSTGVLEALERQLEALRAQLAALEIYKDIQALERVIRITRGQSGAQVRETTRVSEVAHVISRQPSERAESAVSSSLKSAAEEVLRGRSDPVATKEILLALEAKGVHVPGEMPQNNLSAHMSRDTRFVSFGRLGWRLAADVQPELDVAGQSARGFVLGLSEDELASLAKHLEAHNDLPQELDRRALSSARDVISRSLTDQERHFLRSEIKRLVLELANTREASVEHVVDFSLDL